MIELLLARLREQHVYLLAENALPCHTALGFRPQGIGLARVVGEWLAG